MTFYDIRITKRWNSNKDGGVVLVGNGSSFLILDKTNVGIMMLVPPGDAGKDDTSAEGRGDQLLRAVRKLQQDEKVHCAYLAVHIFKDKVENGYFLSG